MAARFAGSDALRVTDPRSGRCRSPKALSSFQPGLPFDGGRAVIPNAVMRAIALNFGGADCASTSFRVLGMAEPLKRRGIELESHVANPFSDWNSLARFDLVLVQKRLFSTNRVRGIRRLARRLVYDVDDAIWHPHGAPHHWLTRWRTQRRLAAIVKAADMCTAANGVLARHLGSWARRVERIPMALPEAQWSMRSIASSPAEPVRIGWIGGPGNLRYLEALEPELSVVKQRRPSVEIEVFCGQAPGFRSLPFKLIPYDAALESATARRFDIGLLPLPTDAFAQGKSPIKALQYLASGAAIVASPVGATTEMLESGRTALFARNDAEWVDAVLRLVDDRGLRGELARSGRAVFEANYTVERVAEGMAAAWLSLG